jgi:tetratricopeptide (TPR) repeat protein
MKTINNGIANEYNGQSSLNKQSVFICSDESDFGIRQKLVEDIAWNGGECDCVVRYVASIDKCPSDDILEAEIRQASAVVFFVTEKTINTYKDNNNAYKEYTYAKNNGIPIIPLVSGMEKRNFSEVFGRQHVLDYFPPDSEDKNKRLRYMNNLKQELKEYVSEKDFIETVESKAFKAKVFLSYRHNDVADAGVLRQLLRSDSRMDAVTIWYDQYLDAGESYEQGIQNAIDKCDVFMMLVTNSLLDEGNFVMAQEYPYVIGKRSGIKKGAVSSDDAPRKNIIAVSMSNSLDGLLDYKRLLSHFQGIENYIVNTNEELFSYFQDVLREKLNSESTNEEHLCLGYAYLKGIGVDKDVHKGIKILSEVSESEIDINSLNAANQLANMFETGRAVSVDLLKALKYSKRYLDMAETVYAHDNYKLMYYCGFGRTRVARLYRKLGDYKASYDVFNSMLTKNFNDFYEEGLLYNAVCEYPKAIERLNTCLRMAERESAVDIVIDSYIGLADVYLNAEEYRKAFDYVTTALEYALELYDVDGDKTVDCYLILGKISYKVGDFEKAKVNLELAFDFKRMSLGHKNEEVSDIGYLLACVYIKLHIGELNEPMYNPLLFIVNYLKVNADKYDNRHYADKVGNTILSLYEGYELAEQIKVCVSLAGLCFENELYYFAIYFWRTAAATLDKTEITAQLLFTGKNKDLFSAFGLTEEQCDLNMHFLISVLFQSIGETYKFMDNASRALHYLTQALSYRTKVVTENHSDVISLQNMINELEYNMLPY